jgi:hypothetical protein
MRGEAIDAPALAALSWACAVLAACLLLWAGITHDGVRAVLLLVAAAAAWGRRIVLRLSVLAQGEAEPEARHEGSGNLADLAQLALMLLAAGFCAFGSGFFVLGPLLAGLALLLLIGGGLVASRLGRPSAPRPDPGLVIAVFALIAAVEPLWRWRGESLLIGLFAACGTLVAWIGRLARPQLT